MIVTDKHVFFYGGVFSNWYPSKFVWRGVEFYNGEQAMMYAKATIMGDKEAGNKILQEKDPAKIKSLGRSVANYNDDLWGEVRFDIVYDFLLNKFRQNPALLKSLLDTGDRTLVEASPYDTIWGIGLGHDDDRIYDESFWRGANLLGMALTDVKKQLKSEV